MTDLFCWSEAVHVFSCFAKGGPRWDPNKVFSWWGGSAAKLKAELVHAHLSVSLANSAPEQEVRATGFFEAAFLCAVALLMITAIQMES